MYEKEALEDQEYETRTIEVDVTKTIRLISLKVGPIGFHGLSLIDTNGDYVVKEDWAKGKARWVTREIPEDEEIIGIQCDKYMRRLSFICHQPGKF